MLVIDGEQFLSTSEVALRFGVSPRTILRWHENNPEEMGAVTGINGRMYFNKNKIDQTIRRIYFKPDVPTNGTRRRIASRRPQVVTA
ncbi:MAG TPA: hypothetical protein VGZ91_08645 [Candidatus Sulfotelmatobacter sp.]|jgi:DNA-binding transcriptional MerR regulator|nr:hypothetical protein [Candidatus Sulfotelmatobacter sp.]